jgi:ABC-type phosphate transport system substrate-binding protein
VKDFVGTDRGITKDLAAEFGALLQFPLYGQAMVVTYNISGLDPNTDPYLVRPPQSLARAVGRC